ncbi:nuclear factor 7, brain-like [Hemicordylus capensis]|uniref:nuclear factor 7, brain-like n=1 Tax=Hemicordylus capensis TaxID=884348 RepID=UPI002302A248|nr:nuclear factor 7, brain-like [Hemicordylus capensis]
MTAKGGARPPITPSPLPLARESRAGVRSLGWVEGRGLKSSPFPVCCLKDCLAEEKEEERSQPDCPALRRMASSDSSLADDLTCPICLAIFQEPQILSCGHNFCLSCLRSCLPKGESQATCPECRRPFELAGLTCNRALASLAKKVRRFQFDARGEGLQPAGAPLVTVGLCAEHEEPLRLFCSQDMVPICVICRDLPQHQGHEFLPTRNAVEDAQALLEPYLGILEELLKDATDDESYQRKEIAVLEKCTEDTLSHISNEFEVLHQILDQKEQDIKKTVEEMKDENLERMEDALSFLEKATLSFTKLTAKVKAALETSDRIAFLKGFRELMDELKKYPQSREVSQEEAQENGICVEEEEESDEKSEKATEHREEAKEGVEDDVEDEEDEDYVADEDEEKETESDNVIPVELVLEEFKDSLNFQAWKEMLENIKPSPLN